MSYSLGPGPLSPAIRQLVVANVVAFLVTIVAPTLTLWFGLRPADVLERFEFWQPVTYMFLHGGLFHLLFNMLALWMFGVELERMWGSRYFLRYYFVTGVGAAVTTIVLSFLPMAFGTQLYTSLTVGASGAVYGVLLAYGLYFPDRPIYYMMIFPIPAKYFVMIIGAISFFSSLDGASGVAHAAHLGGLIAGYLYLKGPRARPMAELAYLIHKWRINRTRRKFDVYTGGQASDRDRRIH